MPNLRKSEDRKPSSKRKSAMTKILELSDRVFKISIINVLKPLNEKVESMEAQMDNISKEMEMKNQKKSQKSKRVRKTTGSLAGWVGGT